MSTPRLYRKGDSFKSVVGDFSVESVVGRVGALRGALPGLSLAPEMTAILELAFADLDVAPADREVGTFFLRPHVIEEIARLSDEDLPRYLFHRYRYDVFPTTKELDAYPPCVQIEPTSICNFRCVFCFQTDPLLTLRKHGHAGQMPFDMFKQIVDQIEGHVEFVTMASRGEPLMTKGIEEMLAYASGKFLGLKMNTNATFLDEKKAHAILQAELNTLVFSADAADAETYAQLRVNGDFEKVMGNIRRFKEIKERDYPDSRLITRVSGVAFDRERQDHHKIENFWREYVDQVAFVDYNPWENAYENEPNGIEEACSDLWRRCFVWWDGKMNPCDVDYRSFLCPGSVEEESVSDIWTGQGYSTLRTKHLERQRQSLSPLPRMRERLMSGEKLTRVLVTGGSGFLGSHIADELVHRGHGVVVLDLEAPEAVDREVVIADVRDLDAVRAAMAGCDAVFHCAAVGDLDLARDLPRQAIEVNVLGTLSVLEAAAAAGTRRFMHASSVYVFSRGGSVYRTTKQAAENLIQDLAGPMEIDATILRFGSLYGPRADEHNAILRLVTQAVTEGRIDFWGDGSEVREYIHIMDAAGLAVDALDDRYVGQSLHITGRERLTTLELVQMINEMMGGDLQVSLRDEPFEGRYRLTPYSFEHSTGRRLTGDTYVDLGLGLLEAIRSVSEQYPREVIDS